MFQKLRLSFENFFMFHIYRHKHKYMYSDGREIKYLNTHHINIIYPEGKQTQNTSILENRIYQ